MLAQAVRDVLSVVSRSEVKGEAEVLFWNQHNKILRLVF